MGKKNKSSSSLGRTLIKDRFGGPRHKKFVNDNSMLHTTEIQDGYDWGRLNLQSVTEESSFQEFLSTAELAGTEFQAEKLNIKFVNPNSNIGLLSKDELKKVKEDQAKHKQFIKIPRRPAWTAETTPSELQQNENENFLEWRRSLAALQEDEGLLLTPYEKNLEFWRQLWRVIEKSDVVVQIVDARNPLLFRCEDLEKYVKEVSSNKMNVILINKADFLTQEQRLHWSNYFTSEGIRVAFFSALIASEKETIEEEDNDNDVKEDSDEIEEVQEEDNKIEQVKSSISKLAEDVDKVAERLGQLSECIKERIEATENENNIIEDSNIKSELYLNSDNLLSREGLIEFFRNVHIGPKVTSDITTIGLVGYPNVGKSSTINALMMAKKVSVSATPGKTKHFQTLYLEKDILLCDCPGLVMPSFVFTKAEMVINGILPIDQMRDHVPPVNLVCHLIPRHVIEDKYGIMLPLPMEGEDEHRPPTPEELLNAYGYNRGFMTANGQPDNPRSARYILKDYMNGKLLYAHAPLNVAQDLYHTWPEKEKIVSQSRKPTPREVRANKSGKMSAEELDNMFFKRSYQDVHMKGKLGKSGGIPSNMTRGGSQSGSTESILVEKPWKKINKHENKNKREKLRRVYAHLDQH